MPVPMFTLNQLGVKLSVIRVSSRLIFDRRVGLSADGPDTSWRCCDADADGRAVDVMLSPSGRGESMPDTACVIDVMSGVEGIHILSYSPLRFKSSCTPSNTSLS